MTATKAPSRDEISEALQAGRLMDRARAEAQLDDFGELTFVEGLERWLDAMRTEVTVSALGLEIMSANVVRLLVNRLRMERDFSAHPEIAAENVSDPIIITGLPRTGTTKLQRMLARHPGLRGFEMWRLLNPAPFADSHRDGPDPRIAFAEQQAEMMTQMFPAFRAAHPMLPLEPDEELFAMEMTFEALTYWRAEIPSYRDWWRRRPREIQYVFLARLCQYLQWQAGGRGRRRLVLKTPVHLGNLDMVARWFPGATVVVCHRDPRITLPSSAKLLEAIQALATDDIDRRSIGNHVVDYFSTAASAHLEQRDALNRRVRIYDVDYTEIVEHPMRAIREILALHGVDLGAADETTIAEWASENPQHRFGRHEYRGEDYCLSDERIAKAFVGYMGRFIENSPAWRA